MAYILGLHPLCQIHLYKIFKTDILDVLFLRGGYFSGKKKKGKKSYKSHQYGVPSYTFIFRAQLCKQFYILFTLYDPFRSSDEM